MTIVRLFAGAWLIASFIPAVLGGQDGSPPTFPAPSVTIRESSGLTNAPTAATATVVPEPSLPQMTVPKPAQIDIPSATAVPSGSTPSAFRAQPMTLPTAQSLLLKNAQSGPTGPQNKLAAITAPLSPIVLTNVLSPDAATPLTTNSPTDQTDIWHKNVPSLDGVNYHW